MFKFLKKKKVENHKMPIPVGVDMVENSVTAYSEDVKKQEIFSSFSNVEKMSANAAINGASFNSNNKASKVVDNYIDNKEPKKIKNVEKK